MESGASGNQAPTAKRGYALCGLCWSCDVVTLKCYLSSRGLAPESFETDFQHAGSRDFTGFRDWMKSFPCDPLTKRSQRGLFLRFLPVIFRRSQKHQTQPKLNQSRKTEGQNNERGANHNWVERSENILQACCNPRNCGSSTSRVYRVNGGRPREGNGRNGWNRCNCGNA